MCEDFLVTDVVRTIIAITSTVGSGALIPTFSRKDFTTPWRTAVELTKRTMQKRVHLRREQEWRAQAPTPSHQTGEQEWREKVPTLAHPPETQGWSAQAPLPMQLMDAPGMRKKKRTGGTTGTPAVTGLGGHPGPPMATMRGGRRGLRAVARLSRRIETVH